MAEAIYTDYSIPNFNPDLDLGLPGSIPFTRGIHSSMYQGKEFTMRQLTGFGSPSDTNKRIKYMLANGATGISVLFDFPTIQLSDSDSPASKGHVGFSGVCIDTVEDMHLLFDGIDLEKHSISLVTHYPSNTAILFSMFLAMAEEKGYNFNNLRGSVQNDMTMEEVVRCGYYFIPPQNCFRLQCDNIEFIRNYLPKWSPITLNGYNLRETGTSDITEMAVAIANGLETISKLQSRGYEPEFIASRIAFFWSISNNFLNEVARLRAVRKVWCNLLIKRFSISNLNALKLKCHVQTSGISLTRQEPYNNIIRSTIQALAAIFGGVQSLHVDSYDEAYSVPSEEAALISLRTQQIIQSETGITDIVDPLGGSYFIEYKTLEYEKAIKAELAKIEDAGGYIVLVESGDLHRSIAKFAYDQQKSIDLGTFPIVGLNKYCTSNSQTIEGFTYPEGVEANQIWFLADVKSKRNNQDVFNSLSNLSNSCKDGSNLLASCLECAKARCTKEEMYNVFKDSFGLWRPNNG
jgi:methylmalonyl-CoA mutase N-terminal domain/subunit